MDGLEVGEAPVRAEYPMFVYKCVCLLWAGGRAISKRRLDLCRSSDAKGAGSGGKSAIGATVPSAQEPRRAAWAWDKKSKSLV